MDKKRTDEIDQFLKQVEREFKPEHIILFGSRAGEDYLEQSDYDIIVVSEMFEGIHFLNRMTMLYELWDYDFDLDILAYTPDEFEEKKKEIGIVSEAVKEGIELAKT
ncbi:MAG: nucleotidyltransferase [Candidatus Syntrophoarchaeum caldarius]|uniref:Nucleotidyltransferase n=1 Tax=Candidatus Syntropharchaeum caldarium TaxID=1838285 RepID=A0A1F2PCK8_9EURY|nr:MAG: nucleotidyltransferase [Candidatus Syntrophoarchaeum caldarius]